MSTYGSEPLICTPPPVWRLQQLFLHVLKAQLSEPLLYSNWNISVSSTSSWFAETSTPETEKTFAGKARWPEKIKIIIKNARKPGIVFLHPEFIKFVQTVACFRKFKPNLLTKFAYKTGFGVSNCRRNYSLYIHCTCLSHEIRIYFQREESAPSKSPENIWNKMVAY